MLLQVKTRREQLFVARQEVVRAGIGGQHAERQPYNLAVEEQVRDQICFV